MKYVCLLLLGVVAFSATAQQIQRTTDSLIVFNDHCKVIVDGHTGKVHYCFASGAQLQNATAYIEDKQTGLFESDQFSRHTITTTALSDLHGKGINIKLVHAAANKPLQLVQYINVYESQPFILVSAQAIGNNTKLTTRNFSPLTILPSKEGKCIFPGPRTLFTDYPFDNDSWVDVIAQTWPLNGQSVSGLSYELASVYDDAGMQGFVVGSVVHDFWKTGIRYGTGIKQGIIDSLVVFGGVATKDNPALPDSYGGKDGTHDYMAHGAQVGDTVFSPVLYLSASTDIRNDLAGFGAVVKKTAGAQTWSHPVPVYWNSFGVEGVLGYTKKMMPNDMRTVSGFINSLDNLNKYARPVLSIDSYDQGIFSTDVLKTVGYFGEQQGQQMGFYFIPFALWTWKNNINNASLTGTNHPLREVILRDSSGNYIPYKDGDWGAFPIDPTHPATREYIIGQLTKAKAINAKFLKIDFLTAGALESATRYNPAIHSGLQAYNYGMQLLKHLCDSILGPDVFISQAISPLFPHQYAHTRFLSTDVYSHLRNDLPGFPHYGSTCASLISATHFWWTQGSLWPYTNMDVVVMKNFQSNPAITEQDVKVRLYAMMVMGSLLGDGSDYRNKAEASRAKKYLNNAAVCEYFSHPKAFTPLRFPEGQSQAQQLAYYLPGDTLMVAAFNFDLNAPYTATFNRQQLHWKDGTYVLQDFLTGKTVGRIKKGQEQFTVTVASRDAVMIRAVGSGQ
jgi:alpha-galactosidase